MAHSAYPELGESAIEKLLDASGSTMRNLPLPTDKILGASTLNIGTITGGRAPNVIPDHASAEVFIRLIDDGARNAHCHESRRERKSGAPRGADDAGACISARCPVSKPPWFRSPPTFRRSAIAGASRICSGPAPFTSRTRPKNEFRSARSWKQSKSIREWSSSYIRVKPRIPVGILGATGMVGQEFVKFLAGPSVVRYHVARRERSLGWQALSRGHQLAAGWRDARWRATC